ncbi:MAG: hypothetical protein K6E35_02550, partial [Bacteroidales bacterium]|nr:hypothetical protein [Bacteroidales bacterium]
MIRKIVTLVAMLLVTTGALALPRSRAALSQYQYNHRLYIMASAGPMTTFSENSDSYATYGVGGDRLVYFGSVSLGYNVTDTWDIRLSGSYSRNAGALLPYRGFFPYSYNSVVVFADAVVNYNALGEHFIAF